jgi:Dolichyl-phosphate-mannose-protein mannosyltransferase
MSRTPRFAFLPGGALLAATTDELLRALDGLFQSTAPTQATDRTRVLHLVLLAAIVGVGAFVRFWALGNVGLHGDEETMAMAARHILEDGTTRLPGGMLYPRGLTQLYLMALSVQVFGESEWAWRLPSALCGVALIMLAYLAGRRFLRPQWNLAFTASVALLPELIVYSQTARMYIFMLASIAACMTCVFAWERSGRLAWLAGAVVALTFGIDAQALTVTSVLLLLLPGALQRDMRKITYGLAAVAVVMSLYLLIDGWVNAQYPVPPPEYAADLGPPQWTRTPHTLPLALSFQVALWGTGLVVAFLALLVGRSIQSRAAAVMVTLLLFATVLCQVMLSYHVAALLLLAALLLARRSGEQRTVWQFSLFLIGSALIALVQVTLLASRPGSVLHLIGAIVGRPSVWPYAKIAEISWAAAALAAAGIAWGLWRVSLRRPAPDFSLLATLGIWIPLFMIGFFVWYLPPRYTAASLLPLLLCAFAFAQALSDEMRQRWLAGNDFRGLGAHLQGMLAALTTVLVVNPVAIARVVNQDYSNHPDHDGAAQFMRSQGLTSEDIVLAEDVLQQTYYLGSVDYWLIGRHHARRYVERLDGRIVDFYTHTPVIGSAEQLEQLLEQERGKRIFIIGSGENQKDGRREVRGEGLHRLMQSDRFRVVYTGRDGLTRVWRADLPAPVTHAADTQASE